MDLQHSYWTTEDRRLAREHGLVGRDGPMPATILSDDEEDAALGPDGALAGTVAPEGIEERWHARYTLSSLVEGPIARALQERTALLDSMVRLPDEPRGKIGDARALELATMLSPLRRRLSDWTAIRRAVTSAWSALAYRAESGEPCPLEPLDPHEIGLAKYNKLVTRLYQRTEKYRKAKAKYNGDPKRVAARAAAMKERRQDPAYKERERARAKERYQRQAAVNRMVDEICAPDEEVAS